jgi:hypothetical protein
VPRKRKPTTQQRIDHARWLEELKRRDAERAHDKHDQFIESTNRATIENGQLAIRTFVLVNGGAGVSVLAFIGSLATEDKIKLDQLSNVASALIWFALGVAAAMVSLGFSYFTNYLAVTHAGSMQKKWEHPWITDGSQTGRWAIAAETCKAIAIVFAVFSVVLFVVGMYDVRASITALR